MSTFVILEEKKSDRQAYHISLTRIEDTKRRKSQATNGLFVLFWFIFNMSDIDNFVDTDDFLSSILSKLSHAVLVYPKYTFRSQKPKTY
jgi:hypothetical protein